MAICIYLDHLLRLHIRNVNILFFLNWFYLIEGKGKEEEHNLIIVIKSVEIILTLLHLSI